MIYHLVEYLKDLGVDLPGQGLFSYLSFRAIISFTTALLISIFAGKRIIRWIQKKQIGDGGFYRLVKSGGVLEAPRFHSHTVQGIQHQFTNRGIIFKKIYHS